MKRAILFVAFAALCGAQTTVNGGRDYKGTLKASGSVSAVDFSGAGGTAPARAGTSASRPTACTQGQIYFATDVAAGQNLYFCTVTGTPGVWTQMSGNTANAMTAGPGVPAGSCAPPALYIDTTNQDLWYCGAANSWKKPTADTSGFPTVNGSNTWTGTNTLSSGQWRASGGSAAVDFSGAGSTAPAKAGTSASRPTACTQGQIYFATDVAAGQNLYFCTVTGAPGVWTQMSGNTATVMTAGAGAPSGNCTPPVVYIDTTNQDLWFCGAANTWKRPAADTSGLPTLAGTNTWTGYSNLSGGQWRPPESTVANLPSAAGNVGKVFMVTDAAAAGSCSTGGGSLREMCRANGATYECVGGCGSGGGGSGTTAYISSLLAGPDLTRTITGATHGFATGALLVAVYDNASPRNAISVGWTVNPGTYDVTLAFASAQSNYYVVINGGVGPQGATGSSGPAGPAPSGTGIVKVTAGSAGLAVAGADYAVATNGTSGQVLVSNGAGGFGTAVSRSGTGNIASATGTLTNGHCVSIDSSGNFVDAGGACTTGGGGGTVNSGTSGAIAYYASTGTGVSGGNFTGDVTNTALATQVTATHLAAALQIAQGGTGTASTLTGLMRGSSPAMTAAELSGDATTSGSNAVTVAPKLRTHSGCFDLGADNAAADLVDADIGPQGRIFLVPVAATVIEITVSANAGTPNAIVQKNHAGTATDLVSATLATASSGAVACAATGAACLDGTVKSGTVSIVTAGSANVLAAGDWIQTKAGSGFASSGAKRLSVCLTYTVN